MQFLRAYIVPAYQQWEYAELTVRSILEGDRQAKVFLIDDGSPNYRHDQWRSLSQTGRLSVDRFPKNDRNLTRSWNLGLRMARDQKIPTAVVTNSDVIFPAGWHEPMEEVLTREPKWFLGPLTNTPGPVKLQQVSRYLKDYTPSYRPQDVQATQDTLIKIQQQVVSTAIKSPINGFCMVARTQAWWDNAWDAWNSSPEHVFSPFIKMAGNEDEFFKRLKKKTPGMTKVITNSFAFHFRSVSRGLKNHKDGSLRLEK